MSLAVSSHQFELFLPLLSLIFSAQLPTRFAFLLGQFILLRQIVEFARNLRGFFETK